MRGKGKRGRHLARYVSIFLLSGGYTLPSLLPVYAAPVTGQSVTVDASHPAVTSSDPTNTPAGEPTHLAVAAGDAPAGNVGDVTGNSLTIQATSASTMSGILNVYAGRTLGTGNANGNTLTIDGRYSFPALIPNATNPTWPGYRPLLYAGYTRNGNADGNTVIIRNVVDTGANQPNPYAYTGLTYSGTVYAGYTAGGGTAHNNRVVLHNAQALGNVKIYGGNNPANRTSNNVLQITSKNNRVGGIYGFKTMEFVLDNSLKAADSIWSNAHLVADYMLYVKDNTLQSFDWDQIVVKNYQSWFDHQIALGKKRPVLYLYFPSAMTLYGYAPTLLYNNGDYEYGKTATSYTNGAGIQNPTGIVAASQFRLLGLRYKNATETLTAQTPQLHESSPKGSYAGVSIYGNTTEHNKLTISGGTHTAARAGYTIAKNGSTKNNTLTITGGTVGEAYGGWTEGQNLLASTAVDETHPVAVNTGANAEAEGNKLNLSGGTIGANGKIAGGYIAKYTLHQSHLVSAGDVKTNKVNISGGTIGNNTAIYGGYTEGSGNATDNEVTISDGTFGNGAKIHGGATAGRGRQLTANPDVANDTVTASKATGNTVTITGGTFGTGMDIYGGNTGGTGAATGNTITLGANDLAMGGVFLHGGYGAAASDVMTDNTLNVKGKNITVRGVENFGKANFDLVNKAVGDTLLKITGGATNKIDWAGVEVVLLPTYSFTPKSYDKRLFTLMDNEDGISFMKGTTDTYATIGAKERTFGNYEFVIDTDNHTGHATRYVYADGFQFKDNTAATYTSAEGTHDAAWAGRTATGNKVEGNKLTVTGGSITNAYGGFVVNNKRDASGNPLTTGDADNNTLILAKDAANPSAATPAVTGSAYGALVKTKAGSATNNKVDFSAGHVAGSLYGGALTATGATGAATGNTITITGAATVGGDVYGGYTTGTGATTGNTVNLGDGTEAGKLTTPAGSATVAGTIYGGSGTATTDNVLNVNGNATVGNIKNFAAVNFHYASATTNTASPMLKITDGTATALDWSTFGYTGGIPSGGKLTLMQNAANISVANYTGAREITSTSTTSEVAIDTLNHTATSTAIVVSGYTYHGVDDTPAASTGSSSEDIWAGRSIIGNATTANKLTLKNGTTHRDAYGGWTAGTGTLKTPTNDSTGNAVDLQNATVRNVYGGFTASTGGSAADNVVKVSGGTVAADASGVGGNVYGGFISHTGAGNATGNAVTITGGAMKDVYGGYTNGTGQATGNTVTIGDGTNALPTGTSIAGYLYGGNQADDTGNKLVVNTPVSVKNIKKFETLSFNLAKNVYAANPLLSLTDGVQTAGLDWAKVDVTFPSSFTPSSYKERLVTLMHNTSGISFMKNGVDTYTPIKEKRRTSGDFEYVTDTDSHGVTATQDVYVNGFRFRNNQSAVYKATDGTNPAAWAGRTGVGNKVEQNKLTVTGGSLTHAYGGYVENHLYDAAGNPLTTGDAESNALVIAADAANPSAPPTITGDVYGAKVMVKDGAAKKNTAAISGGTVTGNVYGAALTAVAATKDAEENGVGISGGTVTGNIYGSAVLDAGASGKAAKSSVTIKGGAITGDVFGGFTGGTGDAGENTVEITGGTLAGNVTGGRAVSGDADSNTVRVMVNAGSVTGGSSTGGSASHNKVYITNAAITGNVTGGSGTVTTDNAIHLQGAAVTGDVIGGTAGSTDNVLALHYSAARPTNRIHDFSNIQKLHFYLDENVDGSMPPMLQLGVAAKNIATLDVGFGIAGHARRLRNSDTIHLMKLAPGGTLTIAGATQANIVTGMQGVSILYDFELMRQGTDELVARVLRATVNSGSKSFAEPRCGATDFINRGADLLAASGISSAAKEGGRAEDDEKRGYQLWAAMSQGTMRVETGSYVTTTGYNLSVGWAKEGKRKAAKTLFTPFVEYGRGTYHTYLDDGTHGSGKISYLGAGLMGRIECPGGHWLEAALHSGRVRSDYTGTIVAGTVSTYDSGNAYYAAHIGIGKTRLLHTGDTLNTYLRYFYSRQDGTSPELNTGETYDFDAVASHRMRAGFTFLHREDASKEIYAGLAYEYEFDGEGAASVQGLAADRPALRGGSTMVELGYRFIPPDSRLSCHIRMAGWQGTRRGMTGNIQVSWAL